jgi:predicted ATP-dependent Lon-type protease
MGRLQERRWPSYWNWHWKDDAELRQLKKMAGGIDSTTKESIQRAFAYLNGHKVNMGIAQAFETTDFHVEAINLLNNHVSCDVGIGLVVAIYSALMRQPVQPGLVCSGRSQHLGQYKGSSLPGRASADRNG